MFGSGVLEIAIGMLFIYFLLSSICSAISEWIGGLTASRSRSLEIGIRNLLNDPNGLALSKEVLDHPLIKTLESPGWFSLPGLLAKWWDRFSRPQYISNDLFVTALLDHVAPLGPDSHIRTFDDIWSGLRAKLAALPNPETLKTDLDALKSAAATLTGEAKKAKLKEVEAKKDEADKTSALIESYKSLLALASSTSGDIDKLHTKLEGWYDEGMDRISGWYKRKAQLVLTIIAAVVCVTINADGVSFLLYLNNDSTARAMIAAAARDFVQNPAIIPNGAIVPSDATAETRINALSARFRSFSLPIGWDLTFGAAPAAEGYVAVLRQWPTTPEKWMMKVLGLLFSTIAVSMGAPFYFDLLKQLVNLRMTGDSPVEKKKPKGNTA